MGDADLWLRLAARLDELVKDEAWPAVAELMATMDGEQISVGALKASKIGKKVAKLRKQERAGVGAAAQGLLGKWKAVAGVSPRPSSGLGTAAGASAAGASAPAPAPAPAPAASPAPAPAPAPASASAGKKSLPEQVVDKLVAAFVEPGDVRAVAVAIEQAMAVEYAGKQREYLGKVRQLVFNLKKNDQLRERLLDGDVAPQQLILFSPEELAPLEVQAERAAAREELFQARRLDWDQVPENKAKMMAQMGLKNTGGLLRCGRCRSTNTQYSERQTRSADEPMTVFALCNNCGKRWRQ